MKAISLIFLLIFTLLLNLSAQQPLPCTQITVQDLAGPQPYITGSCLEVNSDLHVNAKNVIMEADQRIHFAPGTKISPNQQGHFKASIRANALSVAWMEPTSVWTVGQYEKLELGINLPDDIQNEILTFLNSGTSAVYPLHLGLNPFNPEEISVEAEFSLAPNQAPAWVYILNQTTRKIHGFWFKNYSRNELSEVYTDYPSDYHFRIRFAPPLIGLWTC